MRWRRYVPLFAFALIAIVIDWHVSNPPRSRLDDRLVGQAFPELSLPSPTPVRSETQPRLVNLFASWCLPCVAEAPVLMTLKQRGVVIDGIAVRDKPEQLAGFLQRNGNPYRSITADSDGSALFRLGSPGVPTTFLVDSRGIIRRQQIGPMVAGDIDDILAALDRAG